MLVMPMKHPLTSYLCRDVVADGKLIGILQGACFAAGVAVLVLSLSALPRLDLTTAQLFLGVLLSVITPLLLIVIGLLLPIAHASMD